jgi:hypothetical protein
MIDGTVPETFKAQQVIRYLTKMPMVVIPVELSASPIHVENRNILHPRSFGSLGLDREYLFAGHFAPPSSLATMLAVRRLRSMLPRSL